MSNAPRSIELEACGHPRSRHTVYRARPCPRRSDRCGLKVDDARAQRPTGEALEAIGRIGHAESRRLRRRDSAFLIPNHSLDVCSSILRRYLRCHRARQGAGPLHILPIPNEEVADERRRFPRLARRENLLRGLPRAARRIRIRAPFPTLRRPRWQAPRPLPQHSRSTPQSRRSSAKAAAQPAAGQAVEPPHPMVAGSTLTETNASEKVGSGNPQVSFNPGNGPLDRVRVDSSGRVAHDEPGRAGRRQSEFAEGRPARARRCWRTSSSAKRSRTSITSAFPSASCTRAARARTAISSATSR